MPHLHVDATTCAGYLYKVDSRVTDTPSTKSGDTSNRRNCDTSFSDVSTVSSSSVSEFFSPTTRRTKRRITQVDSPYGSGSGFMATLFHRNRRGKRRWFVLDRRRRLLIYYSCHTSKSSNATNLMKPKGEVNSASSLIKIKPGLDVFRAGGDITRPGGRIVH